MEIKKYAAESIDNQPIDCYELSNDMGICIELISYGCTITKIIVPDRHGKIANVVLGYKNREDYKNNPLYCGAALGPNAGRISDAKLVIGSESYNLSKNDGVHNIHGGYSNLSYYHWKYVSESVTAEEATIVLSANLEDGRDGFPGNRLIKAKVSIDNSGFLTLTYTCVSDADTYINLSNHTYFNLSGDFSSSGLSQELQMNASTYVQNHGDHIPYQIASVENTPFDFRTMRTLRSNMVKYSDDIQLSYGKGYNNGFVLLSDNTLSEPQVTLRDGVRGRSVSLFTDAPCCVLYSGGYIDKTHLLSDGNYSSQSCAIALEAQDYPNAPNFKGVPCTVLKKAKPYRRVIRYKLVSE